MGFGIRIAVCHRERQSPDPPEVLSGALAYIGGPSRPDG